MTTILLADDDRFFRNSVAAVLGRAGYRVALAADGLDLLRQLDRVKPDLVVTDIFMPDKDGIEILRELSGRASRIPVIAISGGSSGDFDVLHAAGLFGADRVLPKPLDFKEFLAAVKEVAGPPAAAR